ncbi:hypothetical protein [Sorangium cellulosum]|nr:hypothetical protein [Sorangium cellulosum]
MNDDTHSRFYSQCQQHRKVSGGVLSKADAMVIGKRLGIPADELTKVWDEDEEDSGVIGGSSERSDDWAYGRRRDLD